MNTPKNCIDCKDGKYDIITEDYNTININRKEIVVKNVELLKCDSCGQILIPAKSSKKISEYEKNFS